MSSPLDILPPAKKPPKYRNKTTVVDGIQFDSRLEARHHAKLQLLLRAGQIDQIQRQVPYPLTVNGVEICKYVADFVVTYPSGQVEIQDTKGFKTQTYLLKKKLMLAVHGIQIIEIAKK
jgi:hypothetical protein